MVYKTPFLVGYETKRRAGKECTNLVCDAMEVDIGCVKIGLDPEDRIEMYCAS